MLQWRGGSRKKVVTTRRSTFNRQKQYFEQRKRRQQTTELEVTADERNRHGDYNEEKRSLDIIGLTNLTTDYQKDHADDSDDISHAEKATSISHASKCLPSLPSNTTIPRHFIQMEKMKNVGNIPQETQILQRLTQVTSPPQPVQNCSQHFYNASKECKVRSSCKNEHKKSADGDFSLLDILNDDQQKHNSDARLAPETHVAFSVEGLGKITAETPTRTPRHTWREPVVSVGSPKPGKRTKSSFKLQPVSDDLGSEFDTVLQDFEVPFGRLPPVVSYHSEDTFLDKSDFLEHEHFMMHADHTKKDSSVEDDVPTFWNTFGSGENFKAGRSVKKQMDYDREHFGWERHPSKDDGLNVHLPCHSLSDTDKRFFVASSSQISNSDEIILTPPVKPKTCNSFRNEKINSSCTDHLEKLCRRLDREYDLKKHPVEKVYQDFDEDFFENDVNDRRGFSALSNNWISKSYSLLEKPLACDSDDLFSLDDELKGSVLKYSRTGGNNFGYNLSPKDIGLDESGDSFPKSSGGFGGYKSTGSPCSEYHFKPHRKRGSLSDAGLTHTSKNTGQCQFSLNDHGSLLHSPQGSPKNGHFSHKLAKKNIVQDDHDESDFLSTSCTKTRKKKDSNKSGLEDKGSSIRTDLPSQAMDHCLEDEATHGVPTQETKSSPGEEALSVTPQVSPQPERFVSKKVDQTVTCSVSSQNTNEEDCSQENIGVPRADIGENPTDPSYQVMLQSYVLQLLCVQKVLMDSSKEQSQRNT